MIRKNTLFGIWKCSPYKFLLFVQIILNFLVSYISILVSDSANKVVDGKSLFLKNGYIVDRVLVYILFGFIFSFVLHYIKNFYAVNVSYDLRNSGMKKLLDAKFEYIDNHHSSLIVSKLSHDISKVSEYISTGFPDFLSNMIVFVCSFIYLLNINFYILIICMLITPLIWYISRKFSVPTYNTMEGFKKKLDEAHIMVKDSIHNAEVEKAYNLQDIRVEKFEKIMDEAIENYVHYEKYVAWAAPVKYIIESAPTIFCIILCMFNAYYGKITDGELAAFVLLLGNISSPMSKFVTYWLEYKEVKISIERVLEMLTIESEDIKRCENNKCNLGIEKDMKCYELNNVSFSYDKNEIIRKLSFSIKHGQKAAFVGGSGSGKSTLFKLLVGLYKAQNGEIKIYGENIKNINSEFLRSKIAYVEQHTYLFDGTIEDNIKAGQRDADEEEVIEAAKKAYAHDFIKKLPEGYQTKISEGGANLSGGQKQRIALARAFLKKAPILLLDEVTSALDLESEKLIQKALLENSYDKTVIVIAHRLASMINMDQIFFMKNGEIVEQGTHRQLMEKGENYFNLVGGKDEK